MAVEGVPYISPTKRAIGVIAITGAGVAGAFVAGQTGIENPVLLLVVSITPMLLAGIVAILTLRRTSPRMTRNELRIRYAYDTLHAPYWQALIMHGATAAATPLIMLALQPLSAEAYAVRLIAILPIIVMIAAAILHFERQRARRLLGEKAT